MIGFSCCHTWQLQLIPRIGWLGSSWSSSKLLQKVGHALSRSSRGWRWRWRRGWRCDLGLRSLRVLLLLLDVVSAAFLRRWTRSPRLQRVKDGLHTRLESKPACARQGGLRSCALAGGPLLRLPQLEADGLQFLQAIVLVAWREGCVVPFDGRPDVADQGLLQEGQVRLVQGQSNQLDAHGQSRACHHACPGAEVHQNAGFILPKQLRTDLGGSDVGAAKHRCNLGKSSASR